jgi:hypothetical protein
METNTHVYDEDVQDLERDGGRIEAEGPTIRTYVIAIPYSTDTCVREARHVSRLLGDNYRWREDNISDEQYGMSAIHEACLDFCIELMNETNEQYNYNIALVCAMVVVGTQKGMEEDVEGCINLFEGTTECGRFMAI